jgi:hypothetical protein
MPSLKYGAARHARRAGRIAIVTWAACFVGSPGSAIQKDAVTTPSAPAAAIPAPAPPLLRLPELPLTGAVSAAASARGELVVALASAVRAGKQLGAAPPSGPPKHEYTGPDGELLRLQEEVLALELEALGAGKKP